MNATVKYTLGRIGLFLAVLGALLPVPMNLFLKLMIAVLVSAGLAVSCCCAAGATRWPPSLAAAAERRKAEKERLRAALAGDDEGEAGESRQVGPVARHIPPARR